VMLFVVLIPLHPAGSVHK
jgi:hypothetical protein